MVQTGETTSNGAENLVSVAPSVPHDSRSADDPNTAKACFDEIYLQKDPRLYYAVLGGLDYVIPEIAAPVFSQIARHRTAVSPPGRDHEAIIDLGCSFGINAAVLRYGVRLDELRARYLREDVAEMPADRLARSDRLFFKAWPRRLPNPIIGIDASSSAISYALRTGLIQAGYAVDLECDPLPSSLESALTDVGLVISTGCVGYITHRTFSKLMESAHRRYPPWIVSFVLRMFDYDEISRELLDFGLVTEKLAGVTFMQRRFRDAEERDGILAAIAARGLDGSELEANGYLHAELYVSRSAEQVAAMPLHDMITVTSGRNRTGAHGIAITGPAGVRVGAGIGHA